MRASVLGVVRKPELSLFLEHIETTAVRERVVVIWKTRWLVSSNPLVFIQVTYPVFATLRALMSA